MKKIIDLTHTISNSMPVHKYDEPPKIEKIRNLEKDKYNDYRLISGMHVGTHIDGPEHLTNSNILISQIPIDKFIGRGFLIDARNKKIDKSLLRDLSDEENLIVLILTGFDKKFGTQKYFDEHPVVEADFAQELVNRKIKMIGIDFFSPDKYPFEVHKIFFENNILIIENLTNLDKLVEVKNFEIIALPIKIDADSALARVVAIVY
ncbi:cyclase family protein [Candidatus Babeliales bacterium]|nr:cyclase family protein [Candidatus Babeliales bacterium]MCF7899718.1 cyclase family protein [Candidatus Babeliales bacterium]